MRYVVSDIHGEYELFCALLKKIKFSENDVLYVLGDIIDKGKNSIKLLKYVMSLENARLILGNHELTFLKYYRSLSESLAPDELIKKLRDYFSPDTEPLDLDTVERLAALPFYIEGDEFICVHAGLPLDENKLLVPPSAVSAEFLVNDRKFKEPDVIHESPKCVFFGHTETSCISGKNKILGYLRKNVKEPQSVSDYFKIHLDTGAWRSGVLGCFCIDSLKVFYVNKKSL